MKRAVIYTILWIVFSLGLMIGGLWLVALYRIGGPMTDERAARFGRAGGIILVIGLLPIWWGHYMQWLTRLKAARSKPKGKPIRKSPRRK